MVCLSVGLSHHFKSFVLVTLVLVSLTTPRSVRDRGRCRRLSHYPHWIEQRASESARPPANNEKHAAYLVSMASLFSISSPQSMRSSELSPELQQSWAPSPFSLTRWSVRFVQSNAACLHFHSFPLPQFGLFPLSLSRRHITSSFAHSPVSLSLSPCPRYHSRVQVRVH